MKRKMTKDEAIEYLHTMRTVLGELYEDRVKGLPKGSHVAVHEVLDKFLSAIRTIAPDGYEPFEHEFDD